MSGHRLYDVVTGVAIPLFIFLALVERHIKGEPDNAVWYLLVAITLLLIDQRVHRGRDRGHGA